MNKFIREKVNKEEQRAAVNSNIPNPYRASTANPEASPEALALVQPRRDARAGDDTQLARIRTETRNEEQKVAEYIFKEIEENHLEELIDNRELVRVYQTYKAWYEAGLEPTARNFLYHDDLPPMSSLVVGIMDFNHEISPNWKEHF